ncbi:hypothetical protein [Archangium lipolyticum]|uniref:hypothetical protein n=1 Tax=Archangium lipolyticum TaxID=2970465 RepID=UPI00214A7C13|nr:hypothetical protein [Archangium lipolyticum]
MRRGAGHFQPGKISTPTNRLGQFVHGLCLPFHLVRVLLADGQVRWRYLKVCTTQAAAALALAVSCSGSSGEKALESVRPDAWDRQLVYWAAIYSSLQIAQWIVIALSRDYHSELTRELSLRVGQVPEDEPLVPRVWINTRWFGKKLRLRWQALVVFSLGVPLLWVVKKIIPGGNLLFPALLSLWGAWWFVVYTAGKSARAWAEAAPPEPWFLRGWRWLVSRIPLLGWTPFKMYDSLWTTLTRPLFSPAASVERQPWMLAGLAVGRAFSMIPLVRCFLRPVFPVAATHLLEANPPGAASALAPARPPGASRPTG